MEWIKAENLSNDKPVYWRIDPNNVQIRWHVSFQKAHTVGSAPGQILQKDGWYWYTTDYQNYRSSCMFGPFSSDDAAMADCWVAHRPEKGN